MCEWINFKSLLPVLIFPEVGLLDHILVFNFLRNLHIVFHSDCTILLFTLPKGCSFSPSLPTAVIFFSLLIMAILTIVRWYLIMVLICISLMISDIKHLFICLWPFVFLLWKMFKSFVIFKLGYLFIFCYWCLNSLSVLILFLWQNNILS